MQLKGLVLHGRGEALQDALLTTTMLYDIRAANQIQPCATKPSGNSKLEVQAEADRLVQQEGQASPPQSW